MYSFTSLVSVLLGLLLIYTGLTADTEDVYKDIEFVKGKITYYHLYKSINSQKFNGVIHLDTYKKDSSASKYFLFNHIEAFKKNSFERSEVALAPLFL